MTQIDAIKTIRQTIQQLSAAAACAQLDMAAMKRVGRGPHLNQIEPLDQLDALAKQLAAPALGALVIVERAVIAGAQPIKQIK